MPSRNIYPFLCYLTLFLANALSPPWAPEGDHKCYFLDGTFDLNGGPCYSNVGASLCCYSGETCTASSGLCIASPNGNVGTYDNGSSIWRRSCTDVAWQDDACLAIAYGKAWTPCYEQMFLKMFGVMHI